VALAQNSGLAELTWQDNSNNEDGFKIERNVGSGWMEIAAVGANVTSYDDGSVSAPASEALEYQYRVRAFKGSVNSSSSNDSQAFVLAPTGSLSLTALSSTSIRVNWVDNVGSAAGNGFKIERKNGTNGNWVEIADVLTGTLGNTLSYIDTGVGGSATYIYRVRAYRNSATSVPHFSSYSPEQAIAINVTELQPNVQSPQMIGQEFWVDIAINNAQNLFGISFELKYTNTAFVDVVTPTNSSVVPGAFLGNDVIFISNVDETAGKVNIGVSRKAGQGGISGSGIVARAKFTSTLAAPAGMAIVFSFSTVAANEPSGAVITPALKNATVTLNLDGIIVWPGDTNNDKIVNQADILPIGLHFNKTGPARQNASTSWTPQLATAWTPAAATYADGNGDGVINQSDVLPIGLNWGRTHSSPISGADKAKEDLHLNKITAATLSTAVVGNTNPGQDFYIEIRVDNVTNLFGLAFELLYSPTTYLEAQSAEAGSFLGTDVIFFPNIDKTSGKISLGVTGKAGQSGVNGSGIVARIKMRSLSTAPIGAVTQIKLQNPAANDPAGQAINFSVVNQSLVTDVASQNSSTTPAAFALHPNVPNPFSPLGRGTFGNPSTMIHYDLPASGEVTVEIFDMLGKHVRTLVKQRQAAGRHSVSWDGRDAIGKSVASGVYLYQLRADSPSTGSRQGFLQVKKMSLLR